jgi:hypothetical protein
MTAQYPVGARTRSPERAAGPQRYGHSKRAVQPAKKINNAFDSGKRFGALHADHHKIATIL